MKVKCPNCEKQLKLPYEQIRQRVLEEIPSRTGLWVTIIIGSVGIASVLGLLSGMVLSKHNKAEDQGEINRLQEEVAVLTRDKQTIESDLSALRDKQQEISSSSTAAQDQFWIQPEPPQVHNSELIRFASYVTGTSSIPVRTEESGRFRTYQYKTYKSPRGYTYHVIEVQIDTLDWPKNEAQQYGDEERIDIGNEDIVMETIDGKLIKPTFVSFGETTELNSKEIGFEPGPFANISLVFSRETSEGKSRSMMSIRVARLVSEGVGISNREVTALNLNREALQLWFAFCVPSDTQIKSVGLSQKLALSDQRT